MKLTSYSTDKTFNVKGTEVKALEALQIKGEHCTIVYMRDGTEFKVKESVETIKNLLVK